jgi:ribosomal-protein-alanine N-acetyltransferase
VPDDVPALAALEQACFSRPWNAGQIRSEVEGAPGGSALVIEGARGTGIRGWCAVRRVLDELQVMTLAVRPADRRRGLGRWLVRFVLQQAARQGATRAVLEVRAGNRAAIALYESLGFRQIGVRRDYYREPREDALVLAREGLAGRERSPEQES